MVSCVSEFRLQVNRRSFLNGAASLWALAILPAVINADELQRQLRRPVAIARVDANLIALANHRSGSLSFVDWQKGEVVDEVIVGRQLTDVASLDPLTLLTIDSQTHELCVLSRGKDHFSETTRLKVGHTPVSICVAADRRSCSIACLWARQLVVVDLRDLRHLVVTKTIDLPFSPRVQFEIAPGRVFVADAFGGHLAIVDCQAGVVRRERELVATHNMSGVCRAADGALLVTHQMLNHERSTTGSNVHWGDVMANVVRRIRLAWFQSDEPEQTTAADLYYLGHPDDATGDPSTIIRTNDNRQIVAFAGIDQVGLSDRGANAFRRIKVGRRPTDLMLSDDGLTLLTSNRFDDSVSVIDLARARTVSSVSLGPSPPLTLENQGEMLFHDSRLSSDGWFSCHSCHTDGHSNGQMSDTFGDGYRGAPKRVLSLLGTVDTGPWAWNGTVSTLQSQIAKSIVTTMRGPRPSDEQVEALTAYVRTLSPAPALDVARDRHDPEAAERGRRVFRQQGCVDCHPPGTFTSTDVHDVGLKDADGNREFNPPSLIGVSQRNRLLHDNRASSYQESLEVHPYGKQLELSRQEWLDLRSFLNSL